MAIIVQIRATHTIVGYLDPQNNPNRKTEELPHPSLRIHPQAVLQASATVLARLVKPVLTPWTWVHVPNLCNFACTADVFHDARRDCIMPTKRCLKP